ncbi:SpoIID/LytB domain-containing protein [Candidatus Roizmanbacteria bacterium]|nr:SpoIID/LytB domain-containing protein [Candidatus Roizmanbacteria bacterium]
MAVLRVEIDKQTTFLTSEVDKSKKYESELQNKIATLNAQQQQLIAQKLSSLNLPTSAGSGAKGCTDDRTIDPGFSPRFAFFTFGVPNRVGLNQYGAFGRAKAGQSYEDILRAYYNFDEIKEWDTGVKISVEGYGDYSLEEYVKHIYEIPNDWGDKGGMEALKAQAVAARSYALAYTGNGSKSICTTENCQVFQSGEKGGNWGRAVEETRGKVLVQGGNPVKAWFSSTHGGYIFSSGDIGWNSSSWTKNGRDTNGDINSFQDLMDRAYDKDSPWFYCDWGGRSQYSNTAWLKPEEVADIANALLLAKTDSGTTTHLCQTDQAKCSDTWDANKVKEELKSRGQSPLNSVSSINIDWDKGSGRTTNITVSGDGGSHSFNPKEWKDFFNLRAPANIQIVGPLFNVEKR